MKTLHLAITAFTILLLIPVMMNNPAKAECVSNPDWPNAPCYGCPGCIPDQEKQRQDWNPYYEYKGVKFMETMKTQMIEAMKNGTLEDWVNGNQSNYNVWRYYYVNDKAPSLEAVSGLNDEKPYFPPPLQQLTTGIEPKDVACKKGLNLVIKAEDGSPACVKPSSIPRLLGQGWIDARDNNGKYHRGETLNSSGITDLQNESQIIIPDGITLQNSQLNLQPQVIKVILGINNTVKWIKTGDLPSRIQSVYPFSPNWFDGMVYPKKPFYFTFNQTGEYTYHVLGGGGEKQGKIIVTTPEFEQSNLLRPKLLTGGPENIVHMLLTAQDDQLQGPANFTFEQVFPTTKGKIVIADAMSDYLPISYTLNKSIIPLTESNTVNFTKEFLNKVGFVLDGTERFNVRNFGYIIYVNVYQTNNYKIDTQNVSFVFSNDTTIVSFGQWNNNISKQKLALSSNDVTIMAKQFIESEAKTNSYLKKYHASITPIKANLEVIDDKLMWIVFAKVTETIDGKQITLPGSMEIMIDMHSGKVFSWKLLAISYT